MPRGRIVALCFVLLAVALAVVIVSDVWPGLRGPAPGTSEWYWPHLVRPFTRWWPALLASAALLTFGARWLRQDARRDRWPAPGVLVLIGLALQLALIYADRPNVGAELVDRTLSKASSGYLATAGEINDLGAALRDFPALMPTFDNDHARTHPPGFIVLHWLTDHALRRVPRLAETLARPTTFWRCTDLWILSRPPATAAALFLWSWVPPLLAAVTCLPALALGRRWSGSTGARSSALLVATLPALLVFSPTPDQIFAFLSLASLWMLIKGLQEGRWAWLVVAGLVASLMTMLSLGNAAWAALLGLFALWYIISKSASGGVRFSSVRAWAPLLWLGLGTISLWLVYWIGWGVEPWSVAQVGLSQHYELVTSIRRYDWWLGYNLVDMLVFAGPPVVAGFLWLVVTALRPNDSRRSDVGRLALILASVLLAIHVAGSTRGEVGRLWLVFMPLAAVIAAVQFTAAWRDRAAIWLLLAAQVILALAIGLGWRPFYAVILPVERPEMPPISEHVTSRRDAFLTPDGLTMTLLGAVAPDAMSGETLPMTLIWGSDGPTLRPYTVFAQLLGDQGLAAQHDGWPVKGRWPTTCWLPDETIVDVFAISLPGSMARGEYRLVIGLYDATTGERLPTATGTDSVEILRLSR